MICDLCDKDQQNICERSFHFVKPINECLMKKVQENRQIIEELEKINAELLEVFINDKNCEVGLSFATDLIDRHISKLKGEEGSE